MTDRLVPEHFRFCPRCGNSSIARAEGKVNSIRCQRCQFVLFFNPVSAAGALIFNDRGELLVIERARAPSKGKFGIPGGFTDIGERLEEVLKREVKEETNLDVVSFSFFVSFPNEYRYKEVVYPVTDAYFLAEVASFEEMRAEASEVSALRFVDLGKVDEDRWAFPSLKATVRLYQECHR